MKKVILLMIVSLFVLCCNQNKKESTAKAESSKGNFEPITQQDMESAVIYEANIRQYSPEGTLNAFTKDIPELKELGVKIIWLMPIYPISLKNRKATPGKSIEDIDEPNKEEKYLGSYYAISDYTAVNPNFGTMEDFKKLVDTAHENDMYVILDWVANHTGWDHHWLEEHPEYYTKDDEGNITDPINPDTGEKWGWSDVADLNYDNKALWEAMKDEMKFWVEQQNVDGFRCDVAGNVPTPFWNYAVPKLESVKPLFMLAESEKKDLFYEAFDMGYNWEGHHIMNEIAAGEMNVADWDAYMTKIDSTYQKDDFLMNFVTNHDENSWNGTVEERMNKAADAMTAFTYTIEGMPLIYSGQEYGMNKRLRFFRKDTIPKTKGHYWELLTKLGEIKETNQALHGGKKAAAYNRLKTSNDKNIMAFHRKKGDNELIYLANFTDEPQTFTMNTTKEMKNAMNNDTFSLSSDKEYKFDSWEYKILVLK
ncbi:MAG: alpha-amylase family glycosyl hydrolase [Psychroflexus sp.]|nr:alpha-amylase family glycosyl hydrolase [Psychroflexus sp.]